MKVHSRNLLLYFYIFFPLFFLSCKKQNEVVKKQIVLKVKEKTAQKLSKNEKIVTKLEEMKSAFENESKEDMLQFFNFPTKNFIFIRKNEEFRKEIAANNNEITKEHFLEYAKIKKDTNHPSLYQLLITLNLNYLKKINLIEKNLEIKDDECYYMYRIEIQDDNLIISFGSNSNQKYSDEGDCSEGHTFLYFKIINDRIIFNKSDFAG